MAGHPPRARSYRAKSERHSTNRLRNQLISCQGRWLQLSQKSPTQASNPSSGSHLSDPSTSHGLQSPKIQGARAKEERSFQPNPTEHVKNCGSPLTPMPGFRAGTILQRKGGNPGSTPEVGGQVRISSKLDENPGRMTPDRDRAPPGHPVTRSAVIRSANPGQPNDRERTTGPT